MLQLADQPASLDRLREITAEKRRVALTTVCTVGGKVVIEGDAPVMPTSREQRSTTAWAGAPTRSTI